VSKSERFLKTKLKKHKAWSDAEWISKRIRWLCNEAIGKKSSLFRHSISGQWHHPNVKDISEKFVKHLNLKAKHTFPGTLTTSGPVRDAQYSIPCDCGRCYIGDTRRSVEVGIKEHNYNLKQGLFEKSKLAHIRKWWSRCKGQIAMAHPYAYIHTYIHMRKAKKICWNEANVLQIEPNTTYRKYKESAHMPPLYHPIGQPSSDISPIWVAVIIGEVKRLQRRPVHIERENLCCFFLCALVP
jgi:hypothetical protein